MKIKNNTPANLSVYAVSTRGSANKKSMVIPGEATLELDDAEWLSEYAVPAVAIVKAGNLEITVDPVKSDEEVEAEEEAALAAAKALIEASEGTDGKGEGGESTEGEGGEGKKVSAKKASAKKVGA